MRAKIIKSAKFGEPPREQLVGDGQIVDIMPKPDGCNHDFQGWREIDGGRGGERVCTKCGMGAMTYSLRMGI